MGLFKEKFCYKCGQKIGFLSGKSGDDFHICSNCLKKYSADNYLRMGTLKEIATKEEFNRYLEFCEYNRLELKDFKRTKSFFNFIQIDGYAEKVVFLHNCYFEKNEKLYEINPPIYDMDRLVLYNIMNMGISEKKGILNKYVRMKLKIVFGFDNDWFTVACDNTEEVELPISEGVFKDTIMMPPEADELATYLFDNTSQDYREMLIKHMDKNYDASGEWSDIQKKYFQQLKNIRKASAMSSSNMEEYLKGNVLNKVTRKRIAREFDL